MEQVINRTIENDIENKMFNSPKEKTFVDKILSVKNAERTKDLLKKSPLTAEDLGELGAFMASEEQKIVNYDEHNRYIVLKYYIWVCEFINVTKYFYTYQDFLKKNNNVCKTCNNIIDINKLDAINKMKHKQCQCFDHPQSMLLLNLISVYNNQMTIIGTGEKIELDYLPNINIQKKKIMISEHFKEIFENTRIMMENHVKFLVGLYLNISRSSLSVHGVGFSDILSSKFEVDYKNSSTSINSNIETPRKEGFLSRLTK